MKHRLCLPELGGGDALEAIQPGQAVTLSSEQAHYLRRVLRLKPGAEIGLFDGAGNEWSAELAELSSRVATAVILSIGESEPAPVPLVLVASWLKGNAMDTVVQKSVELGATAIWLLDAARSNYKADRERRANKLGHLERVARSAAEQCETRWLPDIEEIGSLNDLLGIDRPGRTLFLDPGGEPLATSAPEPLTVVIGPEGGWSDTERSQVDAAERLEVIGLGTLILRAETAPLAVLAAIRQAWGWQR